MFPFDPRFDTLSDGKLTLRIIEKREGGGAELPFYYYDICVDGVAVGKISIRIGDNFHAYYNGHIGYEVDEPYRGHGYAGKACRLVLEVARHHGMKMVYLTCEEDNLASARTIEGLGAELLETCEIPKEYIYWYEGIPRHRIYQLEL